MRRLLVLLLLVSVSFPSLVWEFNADGPVSVKPVSYQGSAAVVSDDGNIYALDPASGTKRWQASVGSDPLDLFLFDNALVSSTTSGQVTKVAAGGRIVWQVDLNVTDFNASRIYGAGANDNDVFVTADNGVYKITKSGNVSKIMSYKDEISTAPAAGQGYLIFGKGNELIRLSDKGQTQWKASIGEGNFWLSRPVIDSGTVYIGALDKRMHAFATANGLKLWDALTRNWVLGTAELSGKIVYFGSNDGYVYSIDQNGQVRWKSRTQLSVKTQPENGFMGGLQVVFVGGQDRNIYAMSKENGDILWKGPSAGAAGSPLYLQNAVIFGSADSSIYAYSTERACSITNPLEGAVLGRKEVEVSGNFVSEAGGAAVWLNANNGEWVEATTSETEWVYYIDPSQSFATGLNTISCMVVDADGQESGPTFTTVTVNHDPTTPLSEFITSVPPNTIAGEEFSIFVNDGDDGSPVERFRWSLDGGEMRTGDKNISLTFGEPGSHQIVIKKMGFQDATVDLNVYESGVNPLFLVVGIIVIIIIVWQVWIRFLGQRFRKRK